MNHPAGELLSAYLDGETTRSERTEVVAHLADCEPCRVELAELDDARGRVRSLPRLDPPPGLIPEAPTGGRIPLLRRGLVWATSTAVAVALFVATAVVGGGDPPAIDLDQAADRHTARLVVEPGFVTIRAPAGGR